jgi:hypothetical protein
MPKVIAKYSVIWYAYREIGLKLLVHLQRGVMGGFRGAGRGQFNKVNVQCFPQPEKRTKA